jgi:formylglycine-generating enzyme required for sulfatase activity
MRNGSVKVAVDEQDRTLVVDALDQWQTNYRQPEWRFSAPPWGVTYQEPHWIPLSGSERLPVTLVTWWGAKLYSLWAYGMEEMYKNQETFLPLEEQWEWAAMWDPNSRSTRRFPWGEHWAQRHVNSLSYWVDQEAPDYVHRNTLLKEDASLAARVQPVEVDRFEDGASATGCVQMLGNVWEWCIDEIVKRNHPMRVTKGGACISPRGECLPEYQTQFSPEQASEYLGFRCCRTWKP